MISNIVHKIVKKKKKNIKAKSKGNQIVYN